MPDRPRAAPLLIAAAALLAVSLAVFWPGYALYDSVAQFRQVMSGDYDDWHPPAMAWAWTMLHRAVGGGAGPMLVVQAALYWLGLGLIAAALARGGRRGAALAVLCVGVWPPFLGWQIAVLKDAQMAGAAIAAVGIVAWWRLSGRRLPHAAWGAVAVLLGYAMLVRANAAFALVPLAAMLVPRIGTAARVAGVAAGVATVLAVAGPVNHDLLRARRSGVERTEAIYDLAGIAVRVDDARGLPIDDAGRTGLIAAHCVHAYFWDALGDGGRCEAIVAPWRAMPPARLYAALGVAVMHHPFAYAGHRIAHLNSTLRWIVPARWPGAAPPQGSEPNRVGLTDPGAAARTFQHLGGWLVELPPGWPIAWVVAAAVALVVAMRRQATPSRDLAMALLVSALALETSFAVVSIASDWRYHLWAMLAAAIGVVLVGRPRTGERRWVAGGAVVLAAIVVAGGVARAMLPVPPTTYAGMLG